MKEKEISLKGYWKLLLIAGLVIILSIASTLISVLHKVSHEWIGAPPRRVRIIENEYGFPYTWYWEVRDGGLAGEFARYELELFIADTIIYLITYSIIAIFIYWLYRLRARLISFKKGKLLF